MTIEATSLLVGVHGFMAATELILPMHIRRHAGYCTVTANTLSASFVPV